MRIAPLLLPDIRELLQANPAEIREALGEIHPADLAELFLQFSDRERVQFYEILPPDLQVEVFEHLDHEMQTRLLTLLSDQSASHIVNEMASDDRADFIGSLSPEEQRPVLDLLSAEEKEDVDLLLRYPESTAGGLMTTTFVALPEGMTVAEAIAHIRKVAEASETIYYVYVVDGAGRLQGVLSLKDLVLSPDERPIREVMNREVISAHVLDDQEAVSQTMARYDFLALPVVDDENRILGIVTVDDIVDVIQSEAVEDLQLMGAVSPTEEPYHTLSLLMRVRKRLGWLILLFFAQILSASVIQHFSSMIDQVVALTWFVTLLISTGGNAGSQSSAIIVSGLAAGQIRPRQWWRIVLRESIVGIVIGTLLGLLLFSRAVMVDAGIFVALTAGISMFLIVVFATMIGTLIPLILRRLGLDPALTSSPFIATISDITGLLIYFNIARLFWAKISGM